MDNRAVGTRINAALAKKGILQKALAKELNVKDNVVSYFVKGERKPNIEQICTIAKFLDVTTDELLLGTKPQNTNINRALGLSDAAIEALRRLKESDHVLGNPTTPAGKMDAICKALSNDDFLNTLASLMLVENRERGFSDTVRLDNDRNFYSGKLSPDSYAALLTTRLMQTLTTIREGRKFPDYPPYKRRIKATTEELRSKDRLIEGGADHAEKETGRE